MNKAYLLVICLLLSSLTGCLKVVHEYEEDEDNSQIDETKDESDNPINFQPETRDELKTAVDEWIVDSYNASSTYGDINTWDTSLISNMSELFYDNGTFNGDISDWDVSSVTDMGYMFEDATSFNQDISDWDVSSVTDMDGMFDGTDDLSDDNKCYIHSSFDSNENWPYDWEEYCSDD